ncbi:NDP-sugar synthase [Candidatus Woesearchaeota archaeon]|nr:NDP-sugar synthase [Candidatus Woesearchaeota archaeon]
MKKKISITIDEKTLGDIDTIIDYIYIRNRSQAIEHLVRNSLGDNKTAVILAGGSSKKLKLTKDEYKLTAKVGKTRPIDLGLKKLHQNGFKEIFLVGEREMLSRVFEVVGDGTSYGVKISYIEENNSRGTADSLKLLRGKITKTFLVVYGDIIFKSINIEKLWEDHIKLNSVATLMLTTSPEPSKKGIVKMEGNSVLEFIQKPKRSDIYVGFSSMFVAEPEIFDYSGTSLEMEIFPKLTKNELLKGHLSSEKEIHINKIEDLRNIS